MEKGGDYPFFQLEQPMFEPRAEENSVFLCNRLNSAYYPNQKEVEMFTFHRNLSRFSLVTFGLLVFASEAFAQDARETLAYAPPTVSLSADRNMIDACDDQAAVVQLSARATSPNGNPIRYTWTASSGRIEGEGSAVAWNLTGVQPGQHKAYLVINSGKGEELCEAFANTAATVRCVPPIKPTCPQVAITCPEPRRAGQQVTFTSSLKGGTGNVPLVYNWTISGGKIISGQGTHSVTIDTTGMEGQSVTATLALGGYEESCSASCSIQFPVPIVSRKFDEFPDIARNDEKARLDNFAIELQNDPTSTAYVIIYPGRRGRSDAAQTRAQQIVDYMVNSRGFDSSRIVTLIGPQRDEEMVQLWIRPQGATTPTP
jgi:hypothetical protein